VIIRFAVVDLEAWEGVFEFERLLLVAEKWRRGGPAWLLVESPWHKS